MIATTSAGYVSRKKSTNITATTANAVNAGKIFTVSNTAQPSLAYTRSLPSGRNQKHTQKHDEQRSPEPKAWTLAQKSNGPEHRK